MADVYEQVGETRMWDGPFQQPISNTVITAGYGDARSYNEGPITIFHTGVDYSGPVGTPIRAPAPGAVVFSNTLQLFGNTLIIDHGLGVMTGYYHLSRIFVPVGETVAAGQIVAEGGSTGLSSGPHLHWDLRVNNVPVDGLQWIEEDIVGEVLDTLVAEGS
jgi:murein DD-endopeptidase MepM/ murein hydrolase activator NlpD